MSLYDFNQNPVGPLMQFNPGAQQAPPPMHQAFPVPDGQTPDDHAAALYAMLDDAVKEATAHHAQIAPRHNGILDRFATGLSANPIEVPQGMHGTNGFLAHLLAGAGNTFASNRSQEIAADPGSLANRIMRQKQQQAQILDPLSRAVKIGDLIKTQAEAQKALREPATNKGLDATISDATADALNVPRGISYRDATLRQGAERVSAAARSAGVQLSPEVQADLARTYNQTGSISVPLGRNPAASVNQIVSSAIQQNGGPTNAGLAKADYKANTSALTKLTAQKAAVESMSGTAKLNAGLLRDMITKVPQSGAAWSNKPLRDIVKNTGSVDMSKYDAAIETVGKEYTRIINNPNLTGQITDNDKNAGRAMIDRKATGEQIAGVLDFLALESGNRFKGIDAEIQRLRSAITPDRSVPTGAKSGDYVRVRTPDGRTGRVLRKEIPAGWQVIP